MMAHYDSLWKRYTSAGPQPATPVRKASLRVVAAAQQHGSASKPAPPSPARTVKSGPPTHAPGEVRRNARAKYQEALEQALQELQKNPPPEGTIIGSPVALAEAIETACQIAYGALPTLQGPLLTRSCLHITVESAHARFSMLADVARVLP